MRSPRPAPVPSSSAASSAGTPPRPNRLIYVDNPRRAYAQVGQLFYPPQALQAGIHSSAVVHPSACIGQGSQIDAGAVIERDVDIGERCHIGANVVVGEGVLIGDDSMIGANSCISHALIGRRVEIETGVTSARRASASCRGPSALSACRSSAASSSRTA